MKKSIKNMSKKMYPLLTMLFIFTFFLSTGLNAQDFTIGVLAKRGAAKTVKKWKATADYLTKQIPGKSFKILPLDFNKVKPAVEKGKVAFILANSSFYIVLKNAYGAEAIATMVNSRQGKPLKQFGGVIIAKADNSAINTLADLKGKKFMAVKKSSFGGWQMAYRVLKENNIDPFKDFKKLVFGGTHDNVMLAIRNGVVDAGTVRTDTYERMAAEGKIKLSEFKIINKTKHAGFPFACSTQLYPEWPMAKTKQTAETVAGEVAKALLSMPSGSAAAQQAKVIGWTAPLDYKSVDECLKVLQVGPYKIK